MQFYSHQTSPRTFRSVIEVVDFIKSINKLEDAEEIQAGGRIKGLNLPKKKKKKIPYFWKNSVNVQRITEKNEHKNKKLKKKERNT